MQLQIIQNKIHEIRGMRVMLDFDLSELYQVETRVLNQAVKRNLKRFPIDFMFQLTNQEFESLRSQIVILKKIDIESKRGQHSKYLPYAFTEQGIAMLSGILKSDVAIDVNIDIMRAFVILRQYAMGYAELNKKLEEFMLDTNLQFSEVYQVLTELAEQKRLDEKPRNPVGFKQQGNG